jgi:hypothetical protein
MLITYEVCFYERKVRDIAIGPGSSQVIILEPFIKVASYSVASSQFTGYDKQNGNLNKHLYSDCG